MILEMKYFQAQPSELLGKTYLNNSHFYDSYGTKISWNHIFYAFERYLESFKTDQFQNQLNMHQHAYNYNQLRTNTGISNKGITQSELQALISVIRLVNQIALHSEKARIALCEFQRSESGTNTNMNNYGLNDKRFAYHFD